VGAGNPAHPPDADAGVPEIELVPPGEIGAPPPPTVTVYGVPMVTVVDPDL
jgi:hypothetical protein